MAHSSFHILLQSLRSFNFIAFETTFIFLTNDLIVFTSILCTTESKHFVVVRCKTVICFCLWCIGTHTFVIARTECVATGWFITNTWVGAWIWTCCLFDSCYALSRRFGRNCYLWVVCIITCCTVVPIKTMTFKRRSLQNTRTMNTRVRITSIHFNFTERSRISSWTCAAMAKDIWSACAAIFTGWWCAVICVLTSFTCKSCSTNTLKVMG